MKAPRPTAERSPSTLPRRRLAPRAPSSDRGIQRHTALLDATERLLRTNSPDDIGLYQIAEDARTRSGITAAPAHEAAPLQAPELGWLEYQRSGCSAVSAAGNGIFGCRDRAPKTVAKMCERLQRQKSEKRVARNARRNAPFSVLSETCGLRRLDGGRTRARTWDPLIKSRR
jgi:hypothetical protein